MDYKSVAFKADDIEGRTFRGYAATWTLDSVNDVIQKGAFAKTIAERGDRVKILYEHEHTIGKPTVLREDDNGLYVEGTVSKVPKGDEALELMRDGVIDQMSIGYSVPESKSETKPDGSRLIKELKLYEFSPVTFPANENAYVLGVKNLRDAMRKGIPDDQETKEKLLEMIGELTALMKSEPRNSTLEIIQPHQLEAIKQELKKFGR